jgi:hypothetical protein
MASTLNYANTLSPKTARSVLVPPDATDVPAAIVEANKSAVEKIEALERANQALRDGGAAVKGHGRRESRRCHEEGANRSHVPANLTRVLTEDLGSACLE